MTETTTTTEPTTAKKPTRAVGRRKEAAARVRLLDESKEITINGRALVKYFPTKIHQEMIMAPLKAVGIDMGVSAKVAGGGTAGQASAVRHGISRCLVSINEDFKATLKALGFLRRDPRMKERKKFGLKRARRAPQWSKR